MIKLLYKTPLLILLMCFISTVSKAQLGFNYAQYDFGLGAVANRVIGDAESIKTTPAAFVNFTYNHSPFVNYVVEIQAGSMEGGKPESESGRYFKNIYKTIVFRGQLQAGELIDYSGSQLMNFAKNIYLSSGFGYIVNDIRDVNRTSTDPNHYGYYTGGEDKSSELYIPVRLGYEIKIFNQYNEPSTKIDLGAQYNYVFGDNVDGFNAGRSKDKFIQYSIGVKFALGGYTSAGKQIHY
ncbi:hypothetical protein FPZ43_13815 [Mucilaginibacter pallidiroseus]|uniref:Outer membrane protein beta-barrel domain-containing protein n=1 Tax=Mucilaginibacter pallidiroseus TaxID=2599295 RepID=A0A563U878_9SPHI|nr:hypothetical protein [Mucilaginibacter pallidiroseus]TWR27545.1 hypothetical protein FPZ43_13815 [Mucilaginibacter pallidiroseus]